MTGRLPIYLLIDVSESNGTASLSVFQDALRKLMSAIMSDPELVERGCISVITFSDKAEQIVPLTDSLDFQLPELNMHGSRSDLGAALKFVTECANREMVPTTYTPSHLIERKGDLNPFLFLFSNGRADDELEGGIRLLQRQKWEQVVACFPDRNANLDNLKKITVGFHGRGLVFDLESADEQDFDTCFFIPDDIDLCVDADWSKLENEPT